MPKAKLNKYQRKALKGKEERVTGSEIWRLVELSKSPHVRDRREAADNLCPCHVRRRIDEVWDALYRMLEDEDSGVRRAAFHTLYDGGSLDDPGLGPIFERMLEKETHPKLLRQLQFEVERRQKAADEREDMARRATQAVGEYPEQGRCDFCGAEAKVRRDYDTEVNGRAAAVCTKCDG